ncbi:MAG: MBL fold metallo-hydrolase, partial [Candidatus Latescibacteria bacterium]|nr:MBL fold metallo-hydrolase [Candidatus Latescibacterota bacterium]
MIFKQIKAGGDRNFSYIIADEQTGEAAVIDPGGNPVNEQAILKDKNLKLKYIINTHGHYDHTGGNSILAQVTGAEIAMHESAGQGQDIGLRDEDVLKLGSLDLHIIHTPG